MLGRDRLRLRERLDDTADRVRAVLGLGGELELDETRVDLGGCDNDNLGGAARQVDRDVALHLELRLVDVGVPRADDLVDLAHVGEPADRLRPAERPDLVDPEQLGRGGDRPAPAGGVQTTIRSTPGDLGRDGAHDERRDEIARHVDADRLERQPAPFEQHAGLDLERDVGRPLRLVPARHAVGELRAARRGRSSGSGTARAGLDPVELERPTAHRLLARRA